MRPPLISTSYCGVCVELVSGASNMLIVRRTNRTLVSIIRSCTWCFVLCALLQRKQNTKNKVPSTKIKEIDAADSDQAAYRFHISQRRHNDYARRSDRRHLLAHVVRLERSPRERSRAFLIPYQREGLHPSDRELVLPAARNLPLPEPCRDLSGRFHVKSRRVQQTRSEVKQNAIVPACRVSGETERGGCRVRKRRRTG